MIGLGFDVHKLEEGQELVLGGVTIPSTIGTIAHSDGDVVLHSLVDAILGALALGDIGEHFPDTDPKWKEAESGQFVEHAVNLMKQEGYTLVNVDATIVLQTPKILPYKDAMRERIAQLCGLPVKRVSVKATTSEHLGYAGRKEGVHAWVVTELQPR